jgi:RNA polymerase sigma-70 factor (ECF subfamily)
MVNPLDIIKACLQHNEKAKRQLVEMYSSKVAGICRRYLSQKEDVKDLVQDSFIKIFSNLDKFDHSKGDFGAWIYRITLNTVFKHIQKNKNDLQITFSDNDEMIEHWADQKSTVLPDDLSMKDLLAFIDGLPKGRRTVFNMYFIEGYMHHEIAEILNISVGASKAHLNKARMQLIELITQNDI